MLYQANFFSDSAQYSLHSIPGPNREECTEFSAQHLCFIQHRYSRQPTRVQDGQMECSLKKDFYTTTNLEFFPAQDISSTGNLGKKQ